MRIQLLRLLPVHAALTMLYLLGAWVTCAVRWPASVQRASRLGLVALASCWILVLGSGISPGGVWDVPCLVLGVASVAGTPFSLLVLLSARRRAAAV